MLSLLPVTLSFAASGSRVGLSAPSRLGASTMAATFSDVQGTKDRASNLAIMDELKVRGCSTPHSIAPPTIIIGAAPPVAYYGATHHGSTTLESGDASLWNDLTHGHSLLMTTASTCCTLPPPLLHVATASAAHGFRSLATPRYGTV